MVRCKEVVELLGQHTQTSRSWSASMLAKKQQCCMWSQKMVHHRKQHRWSYRTIRSFDRNPYLVLWHTHSCSRFQHKGTDQTTVTHQMRSLPVDNKIKIFNNININEFTQNIEEKYNPLVIKTKVPHKKRINNLTSWYTYTKRYIWLWSTHKVNNLLDIDFRWWISSVEEWVETWNRQ
jgi:hypothetical protein